MMTAIILYLWGYVFADGYLYGKAKFLSWPEQLGKAMRDKK